MKTILSKSGLTFTYIKKLLLFLSFFSIIISYGQIGFKENFIIDDRGYINGPNDVYVGDFDGDGDMDLLAGNKNTVNNKLFWLENTDGNGNFKAKQVINTDDMDVENVYAADLDGDGDLDVISDAVHINRVVWYENTDGLGNFGEQQQLINQYQIKPTFVYASDIDGDGDMDVLCGSREDSEIAWFENLDGKGNFGEYEILIKNPGGIYSFYTSDIDDDGDLDLVATFFDGDKIAWYENTDGLGDFGVQQVITTETNGAQSVFVIDIDGDDDMDVLSSSVYDNKIAWYENLDGEGTFGSQLVISTNAKYATGVHAGDFDGDGDIDVVSSSATDDKIAWYENVNGIGGFAAEQIISNRAEFAVAAYSGDIDGDGDFDVVSVSRNDNKVAWYENTNGQGVFSEQKNLTAIVYKLKASCASDIDGDGDLDVITASDGDAKIAWYENLDGKGSFNSDFQNIISYASSLRYVNSADLDKDGDMDVLTASLNGKVTWYENTNGLGEFGPPQVISSDASGATNVQTMDLDTDGDLDVISSSAYDNKIAWYENLDGNGNFGSQQVITTNAVHASSVYSSDLDGDGDKDILSSSFNDKKIAWYENTDGKGSFGEQQVISTEVNGAQSVYAADLDGDGDIDVLSASKSEGRIDWFENVDGLGSFSSPRVLANNVSSVNNVCAKDMDNDGDMDVVSTNAAGVSWYENLDGEGDFGIKQELVNNMDVYGAISLQVADIDKDGDMDALSAFTTTNTNTPRDLLIWYENLGQVSNEIWGQIQIDLDTNGCGLGDVNVQNLLVTTSDGQNSLSSFTISNGIYQLFPQEGDFNTEITTNLPDFFEVSPSSSTSNFTGVGNTDIVDFCIVPLETINDINISVYPSKDDPRPGFNTSYQIIYNNAGTTQLNGNVTFQFDQSKIQFLSSSETLASQSSNTLTFNFVDLNPFETRTIDLNFNVFTPPTTNINDVLTSVVSIYPLAGDEIPGDNTFTLDQTVIGSYDPNDIRVLEGTEITLDEAYDYLHYIIRFQNTGTASAINVYVENELDEQLDWSTMQLQSLSHTGRVEITNGNQVKFIFDNINLPDSTNDEPNSHGYIAYKIKPKEDVDIGDIFNNSADIFFDFNPAIVTNTVATEIVNTLSSKEVDISEVSVYPNPAYNTLTIDSKSAFDGFKIYDSNGRQLVSGKTETKKINIAIDKLFTGLYFIELNLNGTKQVVKFIKK